MTGRATSRGIEAEPLPTNLGIRDGGVELTLLCPSPALAATGAGLFLASAAYVAGDAGLLLFNLEGALSGAANVRLLRGEGGSATSCTAAKRTGEAFFLVWTC